MSDLPKRPDSLMGWSKEDADAIRQHVADVTEDLRKQVAFLSNKVGKAEAKADELRRDVQHWKTNHDNRVQAARVLIERIDVPLERVQAYREILSLQRTIREQQAIIMTLSKDCGRLKNDLNEAIKTHDDEVEKALDELAAQAQELDMGYGSVSKSNVLRADDFNVALVLISPDDTVTFHWDAIERIAGIKDHPMRHWAMALIAARQLPAGGDDGV